MPHCGSLTTYMPVSIGKDEPVQAMCVCEGGRLRAALRGDLDRYVPAAGRQHCATGGLMPLCAGLLSKGFPATAAYRLNHYARHRVHSRLLGVFPDVLHRIVVALTGIHIDAQAHIGPGLTFPHGGHIVIGPVQLGRDCAIFQGVTLGKNNSIFGNRPFAPDVPTLGDRVWVGPGAVIAGGVTVGDDAVVGANSLVVRDVPPRGVVLGVPARLVSRNGSIAQGTYQAINNHDERGVALTKDPEASPGRP